MNNLIHVFGHVHVPGTDVGSGSKEVKGAGVYWPGRVYCLKEKHLQLRAVFGECGKCCGK